MATTASSLSQSSIDELCAFADVLAEAARKEILPYWRRPIDVESKMEDHRAVAESPVTIADRNAEKAMRALIEEKYPDHGIYGEEVRYICAVLHILTAFLFFFHSAN